MLPEETTVGSFDGLVKDSETRLHEWPSETARVVGYGLGRGSLLGPSAASRFCAETAKVTVSPPA
jgi:hypothetical protein